MDENKTVSETNEVAEVKKVEWKKAVDIPAVIRTVICIAAAVFMTCVTVWGEYVWMSDTPRKTYEGMMKFWLTTNNAANRPLFFSLIICGLIVWGVVAFALMALGMKGYNSGKKYFKNKMSEKGKN